MKDSITKIAMVVALALSSLSHGSYAKDHPHERSAITSGANAPSLAELRESVGKIQEVTADGREIYARLDALAEHDFEQAKFAAEGLRADVIGSLAIAEFLFQALPEMSIIRSYDKNSTEYKLCRAVAEMRHGAKNLDNLVNQILTVSPLRESEISHAALAVLAASGTEASTKWL